MIIEEGISYPELLVKIDELHRDEIEVYCLEKRRWLYVLFIVCRDVGILDNKIVDSIKDWEYFKFNGMEFTVVREVNERGDKIKRDGNMDGLWKKYKKKGFEDGGFVRGCDFGREGGEFIIDDPVEDNVLHKKFFEKFDDYYKGTGVKAEDVFKETGKAEEFVGWMDLINKMVEKDKEEKKMDDELSGEPDGGRLYRKELSEEDKKRMEEIDGMGFSNFIEELKKFNNQKK